MEQLEADTATIIIQRKLPLIYTRKQKMDSSHFVSQTVCTTLDMTKRRPYAPLYLQYRCHFIDLSLFAETQHMRGYDSQMTAESSHFMLPLPSGKGVFMSFHIIRFGFYHLKSCSIRKLGPKVAPMAPGDDGLWRPRCQSLPASPPLSRPASAPCLRAEKVVSPTRSTRSTRSLLRKGGFSGLAATSKPLSDAKTLHPSKLAKTLRTRFFVLDRF